MQADDDPLYRDPELADFYDLENGWAADLEFCRTLAKDARSVLDLGCGTGELAVALAEGRDVVGVDPARAMLDIARGKPAGRGVDWVEADARTVQLARRFDLILLTGHAFQVFLTGEDRRAVLQTIAAHLAPGGRFILDTRNPQAQEWLEWVPGASDRLIEHPRFGTVKAWNDMTHDPATGIVTYETVYEITTSGKRLSASARIAFPEKAELEALITEAGLTIERWMGDWQGNDFTEDAREMIPVGGRQGLGNFEFDSP
ncbi:MAG: methyltransferase domain-containing protein [Shinella sp.]|nr:methyltransferase domain-containing protein [Shinella sp.]